jgi:hypothetical protein
MEDIRSLVIREIDSLASESSGGEGGKRFQLNLLPDTRGQEMLWLRQLIKR